VQHAMVASLLGRLRLQSNLDGIERMSDQHTGHATDRATNKLLPRSY